MVPSSLLPLTYYVVAHAGLAAGLIVLAANPSIAAASFYEPHVVALVHLLTLAWLTGSILGSLYIVGPLVLRVPMPVMKADWLAFGSFVLGTAGMVSHFWINTYDGMAWSAVMVIATVAWVAGRLMRGLRHSKIASGVTLHIVLAFANFLAAATFGIVIGFNRSRGFLTVSPLTAMFAHLHIAAVGFVTMLVIGLAYRLIPMMLPARMPAGRTLSISAILLQSGIVVLTVLLLVDSNNLWIGSVLIAGGLASFVIHVRRMLTDRLPRPPRLPARDWSSWQTHAALLWLIVTVSCGLSLSIGVPEEHRLQVMWTYGVAGLVGFLAQMVTGMQGRLVPLYAWYRAYAAAEAPPPLAAHALASATFARSILLCWAAAVPLLAVGLAAAGQPFIRAGALFLLAGITLGGVYLVRAVHRARASIR